MKLFQDHTLLRIAFISFSLLNANQSIAAIPIDLKTQSALFMRTSTINLNETHRSFDFNKTLHIRFQQTYAGYPVWGADGVMHIPNGGEHLSLHAPTRNTTMNGWVYQNIYADLTTPVSASFTEINAKKSWEQAISFFQNTRTNHSAISKKNIRQIIYIDSTHKAHWAYHISFLTHTAKKIPSQPHFIIDAVTNEIYKKWDNIQTTEDATGGGLGGNEKMGKIIYDGLPAHGLALNITRDALSQQCYLSNDQVTILKDISDEYTTASFPCTTINNQHNNVYWRDVTDASNGAYSPENDALRIGKIVIQMYLDWYGTPPLKTDDSQQMMLTMRVHVPGYENAFWDGDCVTFGDGGEQFYPFVSLGIGAHEISHGFTEQHSNLVYEGQSGGLNESFSDMADRAVHYYINLFHDWNIGSEIKKDPNSSLRYMDAPTKDCQNIPAGHMCSIDNVRDYNANLNVHYSSGVFNKFFYLLATSPNWNVKKAFDIMVLANRSYWTSTTTFSDAACGVLHAASDYGYDLNTVITAASGVGIDITHC